MAKPVIVYLGSLAFAALLGCSGSGGDGTSDSVVPQNKDEALAKLSATHKQNFENWKQQVVKACDASEAFGLDRQRKLESTGLDAAELIRSNNGSLVFSDNAGFAVLSSYNSFSGSGSTKTEESRRVNGQGYTISAETKREGSRCSVYLFGQKVHETFIAESFVIGAHWASGKEAKSTSNVPQIRELGAPGMSEVVQHGVYSLLALSLKPSQNAQNLVAQKLGIQQDQVSKLLKLSHHASGDSALRIENEASAIWSNQEGGNLIAPRGVLTKAFDGTEKILPFELRLAIPQFAFGDTKNAADGGNLKVAVDVLVSQTDSNFHYSTQGMELQGLVAFDEKESVECSRNRATAYRGNSVAAGRIEPSVQVMFSPCRTLYRGIEAASYENGLMRSLVPQIFAGVLPNPQFQYGGWDHVLSKLALGVLDQDKNIRTELDPNSQTRIVGVVADSLELLKHELSRTKNMSQLRESVFGIGLDWSFNGQVVSSVRVGQILQAVDNVADTFQVSSERLLLDMGRQPDGNQDQLYFAQVIDGTYKAEALSALSLAQDLSYFGFERDVFDQVIQKKVSLDELKSWSTRLSTIKTEIAKYSNIGPVKGDLVGLAIKWLKSGEASLQDIGSVYSAIDNAVVPFEESTKELLRALSRSFAGNAEALDFARNLTNEFKQLATVIRDNASALDSESWGQAFFGRVLQNRPAVEQVRAWNQTWMAARDFTQREKTRTKDEFGSSNERNRRDIIEIAVKETWAQVEFSGLETIAEVARAKNTCDRQKGYSSLAVCGGIRLFSKQTGLFFDPAFGGRYIALGRDFAGFMGQLAGSQWTTLRWTMIGEFFGSFQPIWSKCDQNSFQQKAAALKTQVNALARESDQFKKWELERQIKETLRNCQ
jgi:hypothetical protein